jgi:hypothetical protein
MDRQSFLKRKDVIGSDQQKRKNEEKRKKKKREKVELVVRKEIRN